jgi:hypothetical protein
MPTFEGVEITTTIEVDFEVFCGTCGEGLCYESDTRRSRNRGHAQVEVNACPFCIKKKENEIEDLKQEISRLEEQIELLNQ